MKKTFVFLIVLSLLLSCDKNEEKVDTIQFIEVVPGGCAVEETSTLRSTSVVEKDTVSYTLTDGKLDMFVGFTQGCCGAYTTTSTIKEDTIFVTITTSQVSLCECVCYYSYTFKFKDVNKKYPYKVKVDNFLSFEGVIEP